MDRLGDRVRKFDRVFAISMLAWLVLFITGCYFGWFALRTAIDPLGNDVQLDEGVELSAIFFGLFGGLGCGIVPYRLLLFVKWGSDESLYHRYKQTKTGRDERRGLSWAVGLMFTIGVIGGIMVWYDRKVVDSRGILHGDGAFSSRRHSYADVKRIVLYDGLNAPIGYRPVYNLEVQFRDGRPFRLLSNKGRLKPEFLDQIAKYIHERTDLPIDRSESRS